MKTYNVLSTGAYVADGPHGSFVKTADHFEAVGELETRVRELTAQLDHANMRYRGALTQVTALVEQLAKGIATQAPAPVEMRLGAAARVYIPNLDEQLKCRNALCRQSPFEYLGRIWLVDAWGVSPDGSVFYAELREILPS